MYTLQKELVGKRFLCVKEKNSQRPNSRSSRVSNPLDYPWKGGIIRACNEKDYTNKDLKVLVEYDGQVWDTREWLPVYDGRWKIFLVETTMAWAQRSDPGNPHRPMLWPARAFSPLVDKHDLNEENFPVAVEFLGDHLLAFVSNSEMRPYQDDNGLQPALRNNLKVVEELKDWQRMQKSQAILMEGAFTLTGFRVRVYRQQFRQWFSAVITAHDLLSRELSVMDDTVLQTHSVNPMLVQIILLSTEAELDSLQRGEMVRVLPVRQHRQSKVIITAPLTISTASATTSSLSGDAGACNLFGPLTQGQSNSELVTIHYTGQQGNYQTNTTATSNHYKDITPSSVCPDKSNSKEGRINTNVQQASHHARLAAQSSTTPSNNPECNDKVVKPTSNDAVADAFVPYTATPSSYPNNSSSGPVEPQKTAPKTRRKSDSSRRRSSTNQKNRNSATEIRLRVTDAPEQVKPQKPIQAALTSGSAAAAMAALAAPHRTPPHGTNYVVNKSPPTDSHRSPSKISNSLGSPLSSSPSGYMQQSPLRRQQTPVTTSGTHSPYKSPPVSVSIGMSSPFVQSAVVTSETPCSIAPQGSACHLGPYSRHSHCTRNSMSASQLYALQMQQQQRLQQQQQQSEYVERQRHQNVRSLLSQYQTNYYQLQLMVQQQELMQQMPLTPEQQQVVVEAYNQLLYQYQCFQLCQQLTTMRQQDSQQQSVLERENILPDTIRQQIHSAQVRQQEELRQLAPRLEAEHLQTFFRALQQQEMTTEQIEVLYDQLVKQQDQQQKLEKQWQAQQFLKEQQGKWEQGNQEAQLHEYLRQNQEQVQKLMQMPKSPSYLQAAEKQIKQEQKGSKRSSKSTSSTPMANSVLPSASSLGSSNSLSSASSMASVVTSSPGAQKPNEPQQSLPSSCITLGSEQTASGYDERLKQLLELKRKHSPLPKPVPMTSDSASPPHLSKEQHQALDQKSSHVAPCQESTSVALLKNLKKAEKVNEINKAGSSKDMPTKEGAKHESSLKDVFLQDQHKGKKTTSSAGRRGGDGKAHTALLASGLPLTSLSELLMLADNKSFTPSELSVTQALLGDSLITGRSTAQSKSSNTATSRANVQPATAKERKSKSKTAKKLVTPAAENSKEDVVPAVRKSELDMKQTDTASDNFQVDTSARNNNSIASSQTSTPLAEESINCEQSVVVQSLCSGNEDEFFDSKMRVLIFNNESPKIESRAEGGAADVSSGKGVDNSRVSSEVLKPIVKAEEISKKSKGNQKRAVGPKNTKRRRSTCKSEEVTPEMPSEEVTNNDLAAVEASKKNKSARKSGAGSKDRKRRTKSANTVRETPAEKGTDSGCVTSDMLPGETNMNNKCNRKSTNTGSKDSKRRSRSLKIESNSTENSMKLLPEAAPGQEQSKKDTEHASAEEQTNKDGMSLESDLPNEIGMVGLSYKMTALNGTDIVTNSMFLNEKPAEKASKATLKELSLPLLGGNADTVKSEDRRESTAYQSAEKGVVLSMNSMEKAEDRNSLHSNDALVASQEFGKTVASQSTENTLVLNKLCVSKAESRALFDGNDAMLASEECGKNIAPESSEKPEVNGDVSAMNTDQKETKEQLFHEAMKQFIPKQKTEKKKSNSGIMKKESIYTKGKGGHLNRGTICNVKDSKASPVKSLHKHKLNSNSGDSVEMLPVSPADDSAEGTEKESTQSVSFVADQAVGDVLIAESPPGIVLDPNKFEAFTPLTNNMKLSSKSKETIRESKATKTLSKANEKDDHTQGSILTEMKTEGGKEEEFTAEKMLNEGKKKSDKKEERRGRPKGSRNRKRKGELVVDSPQSKKKASEQGKEFFIQEGCCTTLPNLPPCRECRNLQEGVSGIDCCRFNLFRRLKRLKNGTVQGAGFLLPSHATAEESKPWVASDDSTMDLQKSLYILHNVGDEFCNVVETEMKVISSAGKKAVVAYKRAVQGVREMCDACATTIFNIHWVCEKCGFGVCLDCYKLRVKERNDQPEGSKRVFQFKWMSCGPGICHQPKNLTVAQIIPKTLLFDLREELHRTRAKLGIDKGCPCKSPIKCENQQEDAPMVVDADQPTTDEQTPQNTNTASAENKETCAEQNNEVSKEMQQETVSATKDPAPSETATLTTGSQEGDNADEELDDVNLMCDEHLRVESPAGMEMEWLCEEKRQNYFTTKAGFGPSTAKKKELMIPKSECGDLRVSDGLSLLMGYSSSTDSTPVNSPGVANLDSDKPPVSVFPFQETSEKDISGLNLLALVCETQEGENVAENIAVEENEESSRTKVPAPVVTVAEATSSESTVQEDLRSSPDLLAPLITEECPAPHSWFCDGRLLRLQDPLHPGNLKAFESRWSKGEPVLVSEVDKHLNLNLWTPEAFGEEFGSELSDVVNCRTGVVIDNFQVGAFWKGFESIKDRPLDHNGEHMLLKLKDWPPALDFSEKLPRRFEDLMNNAPLPEYTRRNGWRNLVSRLPQFFVTPDLGPKMYNAYGSAACPKEGTTNLHLDMSDAVNIMVYVGVPKDEGAGEKERKDAIAAVDEACDETQRQRVRKHTARIGALWHIFAAKDADKIRALLHKVAKERRMKYPSHHDPIHDQCFYLDHDIRQRLKDEYGVEGWGICQCLGDAVFIPAGAPHQVRNLYSCVKVAEDFVSPEHIAHCFSLTQEFRYLSSKHTNHEDKLQVKNIIYHAVKDAVHVLKGNTNEKTTDKTNAGDES